MRLCERFLWCEEATFPYQNREKTTFSFRSAFSSVGVTRSSTRSIGVVVVGDNDRRLPVNQYVHWRALQGAAGPAMDRHDWRAELLPHIRQIKVNEIMSKLKMCQSHGDDDESLDVQKFSQGFEQKIYAGAASQEDYLQEISSMMRLIDRTAWRAQLSPESRQRIVNKITDTLKRHLPWAGEEGLAEVRRIAVRFEERIYNTATSQSDYLRKISLKMLTMETRGQNTVANSMPPDFVGNGNGSSDAGSVSGAQVLERQVALPEVEREMLQ